VTEVWVANDEGTEIVRARDIAVVGLDYDGNVTVRLARADGTAVRIVGHMAHHQDDRPDDFHRQLIRVIAELSDAAGTFLVRAAHDDTRGWQWVTEPLLWRPSGAHTGDDETCSRRDPALPPDKSLPCPACCSARRGVRRSGPGDTR
jgi:hypothetical protein